MPVTVKDIAQRLGVSHSTVSRALNHSPLISEEVAGRVRKLAYEMGYFPSAAARTLKTRRSRVLGVILPSLEDPFFSEILQGIEEGVQDSGYSLFISAAHRNPGRERGIVQAMVERSAEGVIVCSTSFSEEQSSQFLQYGVPVVVVNNQAAEDFRWSIYHDDVDGSRQVTRHLIELGHRRTAYLGSSRSGRSNEDRLTGFQKELAAAGLPLREEYIQAAAGGGPADGARAVEQLLSLPVPPTAFVCYNDMMAIGALRALQEHGLRVPEQVSLTGFDNITFSAYTNPPLTTFDQPKRFIGAEASRLMLELLNDPPGGPVQPHVRILQGRLLVRGSTSTPAA